MTSWRERCAPTPTPGGQHPLPTMSPVWYPILFWYTPEWSNSSEDGLRRSSPTWGAAEGWGKRGDSEADMNRTKVFFCFLFLLGIGWIGPFATGLRCRNFCLRTSLLGLLFWLLLFLLLLLPEFRILTTTILLSNGSTSSWLSSSSILMIFSSVNIRNFVSLYFWETLCWRQS